MTQDPDPHEALASIRAARAELVRDTRYPVIWDLGYGAICGSLVASQTLPTAYGAPILVLAIVGLAIYVSLWRSRSGFWIDGFSPRRARWIAIGMMVVLLGLVGLALWFRSQEFWWGALIVFAGGFVTAIIGSRIWMRVWRGELVEDAG